MPMGYSLTYAKRSKKEQRAKNKRFKMIQYSLKRFPTKAEKALNACCKALGFKIEPQKTFCGYIVDLYLPQLTVAIEADGGYHADADQVAKDAARTRNIKAKFPSMPIVRYTNEQILNDPDFYHKLNRDLLNASGFSRWPDWVRPDHKPRELAAA